MEQVTAPDGVEVITVDEGSGPTILVLPGGLGDESAWAPVAAELTSRFRVVRIRRRLYRMELTPDPATDFEHEVQDTLAVARGIGGPVVLVGHSSGAIVALETLVADQWPFAGAVLYEPPLVVDGPIGGDALVDAREALDQDRPGRALAIFLRRMVGLPAPLATVVGLMTRFNAELTGFVPRQIDDTEAINRLGNRLTAYEKVAVPTLLVTGARSPAHLRERSATLASHLPHPAQIQMPKQGHGANRQRPAELAGLIATFVDHLDQESP